MPGSPWLTSDAHVMYTLLNIGAAATALMATIAAAGWMWRKLGRPLHLFLLDWRGEPPRAGFPGRPGVPERLERLEVRVAKVEAELSPNHGRSVRDRVEALARHVGVGESEEEEDG